METGLTEGVTKPFEDDANVRDCPSHWERNQNRSSDFGVFTRGTVIHGWMNHNNFLLDRDLDGRLGKEVGEHWLSGKMSRVVGES